MPIYDFICLKCGTRFEDLVPSDNVKVTCHQCRSIDTEKVFPKSFGVSFNAPGFYATDYKRQDWQEQTLKNIKKNKKK